MNNTKVILITATSGLGKSTLSAKIKNQLRGRRVDIIPTDTVRQVMRIENPKDFLLNKQVRHLSHEEHVLQAQQVSQTVAELCRYFAKGDRDYIIVEGFSLDLKTIKEALYDFNVTSVFLEPKNQTYKDRLVENRLEWWPEWDLVHEVLKDQNYHFRLDPKEVDEYILEQIIKH